MVLEMATGERPAADRSRLPEQVERISSQRFKHLVKACIQNHPDKRPSMPEVIRFLTQKFLSMS